MTTKQNADSKQAKAEPVDSQAAASDTKDKKGSPTVAELQAQLTEATDKVTALETANAELDKANKALKNAVGMKVQYRLKPRTFLGVIDNTSRQTAKVVATSRGCGVNQGQTVSIYAHKPTGESIIVFKK